MDKLRVAITVDVEEEGLFSGQYATHPQPPASVHHLHRLEFITAQYGLPLTLLCTYPVIRDSACREVLLGWREQHGAELGAHLHPWNTPPFASGAETEHHLARDIAPDVLRAKLATLLQAHREHLGRPARCFRMGRFDTTDDLLSALPGHGIRVDSSLVPLRTTAQGPDHFWAPTQPHWIIEPSAQSPGLCEAPLTMAALLPAGARAVGGLAKLLGDQAGRRLKKWFRYLGVAGTQPTMYSQAAMRRATRLHLRCGGTVLVMYLHSSELMPGASGAYPDEQAVQGLLDKLAGFLGWLGENHQVQGLRLSQVAGLLEKNRPIQPGQ